MIYFEIQERNDWRYLESDNSGAPLSLSHLSYLVVSFVDLNPRHNGFLVEKKDISIGKRAGD